MIFVVSLSLKMNSQSNWFFFFQIALVQLTIFVKENNFMDKCLHLEIV